MKQYYTNVTLKKGKILIRGIDNGKRFSDEVDYMPYLFVRSNKPGPWKTIDDEQLEKKQFASIWEARQFINKFANVAGAPIYGMQRFVYPYVNDAYPGKITYDTSQIRVGYIDIEVHNIGQTIDKTIEIADKPTTAIALLFNKTMFAFGYKEDFDIRIKHIKLPEDIKIEYVNCNDEKDMLLRFLNVWEELDLDVVTGWNTNGFDIPFLINRISNLFDEEEACRLSPWGMLEEKKIEVFGREKTVKYPVGISCLDYFDLYKKFTYHAEESYKLDWIAQINLDEKKLDYSKYENLYEMYDQDFQMFMEYNIHDTMLVYKLNKKLGFIEQAFAIAYDAHVNYADALTSVLLWDVIVHNKLFKQNIAVNPNVIDEENYEKIEGGYVKEPKPGLYEWVVSDDLDGLYPHLIMGYNMGPETLVKGVKMPVSVESMLHDNAANEPKIKDFLNEHNVSLTPTGYMFKRDKRSFFADLMDSMYQERKSAKAEMLQRENECAKIEAELTKRGINVKDL